MKVAMVYLSEVSGNRDNNLNLIRMLAALGVLVSHAWPISLGSGPAQPLQALTGHALGTLSVYVFFAISGFLIAASYERSRTHRRFVLARVLRLFPALIVSIVGVALLMGPLVTTLAPGAYLTAPETWTFILRNIVLASPQYTLPGVFETNPYPTVEGSIWTLIHEVLCYVGVFVLGVIGALQRRPVMVGVLAAYFALWLAIDVLDLPLHFKLIELHGLSLPFAVGMAFYLWQDRIPVTWPLMILLVGIAALAKGTVAYEPLLILALSYATFWLAYAPRGWIRSYNRVGDYSYGVYIYAFPAQGLAVWLFGPMGPLENILWSLPLTLVPSILSWHWVEKPALDLRQKFDLSPPRQAGAKG